MLYDNDNEDEYGFIKWDCFRFNLSLVSISVQKSLKAWYILY